MMSKTWLFLLCIFALSVQPVTAESKTETLEIDSIGEALPAVNADLVGTQQHLFRKREQIQQDEHLKDGTWGQYDNGVGSGGQSPDRNNQNGDGTDGLGSGQKDNDDSDQGVSLLDSSRRGHHGRGRNHLSLFDPVMPAVLPPVMGPAIVPPVVAPAVVPPVVAPAVLPPVMGPPVIEPVMGMGGMTPPILPPFTR